MKIWIGKAILLIGSIHTLFGFVVAGSIFKELLAEGLINTVNGQIDREFFFWFVHFGVSLILLGCLIDWVEKRAEGLPAWLGWGLLAWTVVLLVVMPISGAWLMLIPAIGAIWQNKKMLAKTA